MAVSACGYNYDTMDGAWRKRWEHLSVAALQFVIEPPCDMWYARTDIDLECLRVFQPVMDAVLRRDAVVTLPEDTLGSKVLNGYG